MALDLSSYSAMLKELYSQQVIENLVYTNNPFLAMVKKRTDFVGSAYPVPIITGNAQGVSATFSDALANQANVVTQQFLVTRKPLFKIASLDNETIDATGTDKGAFLQAMRVQIDGAFNAVKNTAATNLYGDSTGSLATLASNAGTGGTGLVTFSTPQDANKFEVNMTLNAYSSGGVVRADVGYVIAVDRINGTITVATSGLGGAAATPSSWVATDKLYIKGNYGITYAGLAAWLTTPTTGDNFFGVDRTSDPVRLAGVVEDLSTLPAQEALDTGATLINEQGGEPNKMFCSYSYYSEIKAALGAKGQYIDMKGPANITFPSLRLPTAAGMMDVIPDRNCPARKVYMLDMRSWCFHTLKGFPRYLDNDDLTLLRDQNTNSVSLRIGAYGNLWCNAPGWNGAFDV